MIGYTFGSFDLFNVGDLDVLRRSRLACQRLVVGIYTDELVEATSGAPPYVPLGARTEIIKNVQFVDAVVVQPDLDTKAAWERLRFDVAFTYRQGGLPSTEVLERDLAEAGVRVVELEELKKSTSPILRMALDRDLARTSVA